MDGELIHKELSGQIINAAIQVINTLKPGLDEKLYENALLIELSERGHKIEQQKRHTVFYKEKRIGDLIPDIIVDEKVIVDPKVVTDFNESHIAQMTGYLAITGLSLALLPNFKYSTLKWKRIVRSSSA
ncbi:MAG TPA: GxxExxY protein [Kiritimatiellia bacterium]|nr:GxxExxY protein [Kiritimatiellia bacterium]